ncbi:Translin [Backusella circina FSU 941]|nr:Translin [Backusella circina FSU 941]
MDLGFFNELERALEQETIRKDEIRTTVKELDRTVRHLNATLNQVHSNPSGLVPEIDFAQVKKAVETLVKLIPENEFYKYNDLWNRPMQQAVFLVVFKSYLDQGQVVNVIPLSRLCVNAVTVGDYEKPVLISKQVKDLSGGFQLLNLKNDILRKRFDGIKYEVKKIEEVVYDITLRGLYPIHK